MTRVCNLVQTNFPFGRRLTALSVGSSKVRGNRNEISDCKALVMSCPSCPSDNQAELAAEMIIHFSGLKYLDNPGVWVSPKLLVCLDCGFSRFIVPQTELPLLANRAPTRKTPSLERCPESLPPRGAIALRKGA
jgi:hypothetical protein